jgi:hypothetical protein
VLSRYAAIPAAPPDVPSHHVMLPAPLVTAAALAGARRRVCATILANVARDEVPGFS